jgi:endonuclease/exonuclease/phosphatase family metal-dependent hydrolase
MTYNVGNGLAEPMRLAGLLRDVAADVVGLQELAPRQADTLRSDLRDLYPFQVLVPTGFAGKGLLSRFPIITHEQLVLYYNRPDLRAVVDLAEGPLSVLVAHPPPPRLRGSRIAFDAAAVAQLERLSELALDSAPGVLLGDLNMTPRNPLYAEFSAAGLVDAFAVAGSGRGWTLPMRIGQASRFKHGMHRVPLRPVARVDYIWCTPGITAERAWLGGDGGSDHLPVLARLSLTTS